MFKLHEILKNSPSRFTVLLIFLIVQIFMTPIAGSSLLFQQLIYFYTYLVMLSAVATIEGSKVSLYSYFLLFVVSLCFALIFLKTGNIYWLAGSEAMDMLMIGLAARGISLFMLRQKEVTQDLISGAICIYMLAGLLWADAYSLCEIFDTVSFSGLEVSKGIFEARNSLIYFSYVTMLTIGYGDILPVSLMARSLVILQGLFGQMYMTVFIAGTIGIYLNQHKVEKEQAHDLEKNIEKRK